MRSFPAHTSIVFIFLLSFITVDTTAQVLPTSNYPKEYFQWPLDTKPALAANFGELRPNHYHMGLDCRTEQKQNLHVLAAAAGYIAKIKIEPFGFGRCIYINHPNGLTTLYAHLNEFFPELEKYIVEQQYRLKSWKVFLDIPPGLFPVIKGQFIAYSGNTGGSQGPHLHFEIRNTRTDKVLNPSLFGLPIPDNVPPDIFRLAVYDRSISTYEQSPKIYTLKKVNGIYVTTPGLLTASTDKVSFGIAASDRYTGSASRNGIYETVLYDNNKPIIGFQLDSISYDETRYLNAHIDYKYKSSGGSYLQHVSKLPGYNNSVYKTFSGDGVITIDDNMIHKIKLEVKDATGNTSIVQFEIKRKPGFPGIKTIAPPSYFNPKEFHPGFINTFENSNISFYLPENSLYDSIHFRYNEIISNQGYPVYQLHNTSVPLHSYFTVRVKASSSWPDKMVMRRFANGKDDYTKAIPVTAGNKNGWYEARFREFGNFQLMIDTLPPVITPIGFKDEMNTSKLNRIAFSVKDNTEEIKKISATLDGKWLRFSNDKGRIFIYTFDENCQPGEHELILSVEDCVGNKTEKKYHFTR